DFVVSGEQHLVVSECRSATSIGSTRDSDSILAPIVTSSDFCNTIGTSATLPASSRMSGLKGFADKPRIVREGRDNLPPSQEDHNQPRFASCGVREPHGEEA